MAYTVDPYLQKEEISELQQCFMQRYEPLMAEQKQKIEEMQVELKTGLKYILYLFL